MLTSFAVSAEMGKPRPVASTSSVSACLARPSTGRCGVHLVYNGTPSHFVPHYKHSLNSKIGFQTRAIHLKRSKKNLKPSTIAIDGPAASGKSTIGELLARQLNYLYFDTGVMYRAVTWAALMRGASIRDEAAVTKLAQRLRISVIPPTQEDGRQYTVLADDKDVTWAIRTPEVNANVSTVSAYPGVRRALVIQQRRVAAKGSVVMVGRDIGTVVLPGADLKIYVDASVGERAKRRWKEVQARGEEADYEDLLAAMRRRDKIDTTRKASPLRAAEDASIIDTTDLSIEEALAKIEHLVREEACSQD